MGPNGKSLGHGVHDLEDYWIQPLPGSFSSWLTDEQLVRGSSEVVNTDALLFPHRAWDGILCELRPWSSRFPVVYSVPTGISGVLELLDISRLFFFLCEMLLLRASPLQTPFLSCGLYCHVLKDSCM